MQATDLTTLDAVMTAAIAAIVPRATRSGSAALWKPYQQDRKGSASARWFRTEWTNNGYTPNGFFGATMVDTTTTLVIVADYGGLPEYEAEKVAHDDHFQLRDVLNALKSTTAGLLTIEAVGWIFASQENEQPQIEHTFSVRYMQARA